METQTSSEHENIASMHKPTTFLKENCTNPQYSKSSIIWNPHYNKGTAFTMKERDLLNIRGLLPPTVETIDRQRERCCKQLRTMEQPLHKYTYLMLLKERNETLFYNLLLHHIEEFLPIVYTPTVGEACQKFDQIFRIAQGMYFSKDDKGQIRKMLDNWPSSEVRIIVITDGSRILGLGDLGANGMGIPVGKLQLYVAGAGFHPQTTLPVVLDVGTNNDELLRNSLYLGQRHRRLTGKEYDDLMEEFITAAQDKWPHALIQFEDFSNDHCFDLLSKYRNRCHCFNDDIQGTGAVVTAGVINAFKATNTKIEDARFVIVGAGSAGIGVADVLVDWLQDQGVKEEEAIKKFWFVDSKGLVTKNRGDNLQEYKLKYARQDVEKPLKTLLDVVKTVKPTCLVGLSGIAKSFNREVIEEMQTHAERPIIFALSNPTSKSECTAQEAYEWTEGKCIFASGSPFEPVEYKGKKYTPGQGNNMYIFPGLGFGAVLCQAKKVTDSMILTSAKALAECLTKDDMRQGKIYPELLKIRDISAHIAAAVMDKAYEEGVAQFSPKPSNLERFVKEHMYNAQSIEIDEKTIQEELEKQNILCREE